MQRTPEPVNPDESGLNPILDVKGAIDFGRQFQIVSFRWLSEDEISAGEEQELRRMSGN